MDEFALIERILSETATGGAPAWLALGPGDDACIARPPAGHELASSIDSFLADVHFPAAAHPELIGYRCMMASLSDLAAMAATPAWALVALTLAEKSPSPCPPPGEAAQQVDRAAASPANATSGPTSAYTALTSQDRAAPSPANATGEPASLSEDQREWVLGLCRGLAEAAREAGVPIAGGNLAAGPTALTLSVHGWAPAGSMLRRDGARPGDAVCVSAPLGGAAWALAKLDLAKSVPGRLIPQERCYWRPQPPFDLAPELRRHASSGIDISDGLLQDLGHLCKASGVGVRLRSKAIPLAPGVRLQDALGASDDYALAFTTAQGPLRDRFPVIGKVSEERCLRLDGNLTHPKGFRHFRSSG